jgi:hypothetical protein
VNAYLKTIINALEVSLSVINRITSATTNTHKGGEATATVVAAKSHARVTKFLILEEEKISQNAIKKSWRSVRLQRAMPIFYNPW